MDRPLSDLIADKVKEKHPGGGRQKFGGKKVAASARPKKFNNDFPPAFRNRPAGRGRKFKNGPFRRFSAQGFDGSDSGSDSGSSSSSSSSDDGDVRMPKQHQSSSSSVFDRMSDGGESSYTVTITNLSRTVTENDLQQIIHKENATLLPFGGDIGTVLFKFDKAGHFIGEADVKFKSLLHAKRVILKFNKKRLDGLEMRFTLTGHDEPVHEHVEETKEPTRTFERHKKAAKPAGEQKVNLDAAMDDYMTKS